MVDRFTCNLCGKEMGTGYFYCEKCHSMHKKKRDEQIDKSPNMTDKEVLDQIEESEPKQS